MSQLTQMDKIQELLDKARADLLHIKLAALARYNRARCGADRDVWLAFAHDLGRYMNLPALTDGVSEFWVPCR